MIPLKIFHFSNVLELEGWRFGSFAFASGLACAFAAKANVPNVGSNRNSIFFVRWLWFNFLLHWHKYRTVLSNCPEVKLLLCFFPLVKIYCFNVYCLPVCFMVALSNSMTGNVLALGAVADFGALHCQYTTKVDAR
jgi:hypothetical protein